ncbi:MAG: amidohydrolase family protein [Anaerolineales bacterium]|nr:amidohydrolase family protein [Anaerolineales bacterium]
MEKVAPFAQNTVAFTGVSVIPMDAERILDSHTVFVEDGLIAAIGPDGSVPLPGNTQIIDGAGAFLLPGLANMHAHLIEFDPDPRHLALYLAGGVTTVLSLNSQEEVFEWRQKSVRAGWAGPTILMSGPVIVGFPDDYRLLALGLRAAVAAGIVLAGALLLAGAVLAMRLVGGAAPAAEFAGRWAVPWLVVSALAAIVIVWRKLISLRPLAARFVPMAAVVETPSQARAEVKRQARSGVDCIKVYDYLDHDTYLAALKAAKAEGIYTVGHIPEKPDFVSAQEALEEGLSDVAHVDELTHEFLVDFKPETEGWVEWEIDRSKVAAIAGLVATHQAAVTATLVTNESVLLGLEDLDALLQRPEYAYVKAEKLEQWKTGGRFVRWQGQTKYRRKELRPLWMALTEALYTAGAPILLGTDSDVEGIVPGFSEHRELELMVEAGLSPFEALAAGTRNPARAAQKMGADHNWGTIEAGNRADLILLSGNPLDDVRNTRHRLGVMVRGRWMPQAELDRQLADYREGR